MIDYVETSAVLSPCRTWRYSLLRWARSSKSAVLLPVIGLNPSTADETQDDPTIRRVVAFALREGTV